MEYLLSGKKKSADSSAPTNSKEEPREPASVSNKCDHDENKENEPPTSDQRLWQKGPEKILRRISSTNLDRTEQEEAERKKNAKAWRLRMDNLRKLEDTKTLMAVELEIQADFAGINYRIESTRLDSFRDCWPVKFIDPKKLAAAGFFYTKKKDKVRCFACTCPLSEWKEGDDPIVKHKKWSDAGYSCKFVRNLPCGNVPIDADPSTIPRAPKPNEINGGKIMPLSDPDTPVGDLQTEKDVNSDIYYKINNDEEITVFWDSETKFTAKHSHMLGSIIPTYASYEWRLRSFDAWPGETGQKKEDLAAAGFFHRKDLLTSSDDHHTMCYYCGGCLKAWKPTSDPYDEHAKRFPKCRFINKLFHQQANGQLVKKDDLCTSSTEQLQKKDDDMYCHVHIIHDPRNN